MQQKKEIVMLCILAMLCGFFYQPGKIYAETGVKVYITEGSLNHALNRTMSVGEARSGWEIELNKKRTVKSAKWESTAPNIMTVEGNNESAIVTAHSEGTAKLILTVVTNKDETVKNDCIISVITKIDEEKQPAAYVKGIANFYRGASADSEIRNVGQKGQKLTVIALCGDYFRVRLPKDYDFEDTLNQDTAYAKRSDLAIPVTQVKIVNKDDTKSLAPGETAEMEIGYEPELATEKNFEWKSSNPNIVSVSKEGKVKAKKVGTAVVTLQEKNSGKSDACNVSVTRELPVQAGVSKPKLYIKKANDLRGNHISWYGLSEAKQYRLYRGLWNKKKKKVVYKVQKLNRKSYYDTDIVKGRNYYYYIKAYDAKGKLLAKSKRVKIKATAPDLTATAIAMDKIRLDWKEEKSKNLKGIKGYRIYRSEKKNGKYKCVKNIKKKKTFSWVDSKRKKGTFYFYQICAYQKKKGKIKNGSKSFVTSAKTFNSTSEMTNWNYFNSMKDVWKGVYMQRGSVTEQQSTALMNQYHFEVDDDMAYPYVKYHLTTHTLYIHIYVDYCTYVERNGKLVREPLHDMQFQYKGTEQGGSYKQEFENALYEGYQLRIEGSAVDFAPGVNFDTKLVLHEKGKENFHKDQCFLNVKIGGECDGFLINSDRCISNHWFHACPMIFGCIKLDNQYIYMPTNDQLKGPEKLQGYRNCAKHEMGHILGLNEAYNAIDKNGNVIERLIYNNETCVKDFRGYWNNIMKGYREEMKMTMNDIEMALYAYGKCCGNSVDVIQSYKDYVIDGEVVCISDVIRNRKDEKNNEIE